MALFRNVCFTINNPTDSDRKLLSTLPVHYMVVGEEKGEGGTPHLQGYAELATRTRLNALKAFLPRAHLEARKGTAAQAAVYCKKDGDYNEQGVISKQGSRSDIEGLYTAVKSGKTELQLFDDHTAAMFKYRRSASRLMQLLQEEKARSALFVKPLVVVLWGPAGTGKTRTIMQRSPQVYICDMLDQGWFDGYSGQSSILLDDFNGEVPWKTLMRMLDGYRLQLAVKGSSCYKNWNTVYITSNHPPETWYSGEHLAALTRRISFQFEIEYKVEEDCWDRWFLAFTDLCEQNSATQEVGD